MKTKTVTSEEQKFIEFRMQSINFKLETEDLKGKAYYGDYNRPEAQMTFQIKSDSTWVVDHTEVDDHLRGQGIGKKMLQKIVSKAREQEKTINPECPFAKSVFDKNEELQDVLK